MAIPKLFYNPDIELTSTERLVYLTLYNVGDRMPSIFGDDDIHAMLDHYTIGNLTGLTHECVGRTIRKLRDKGLVGYISRRNYVNEYRIFDY